MVTLKTLVLVSNAAGGIMGLITIVGGIHVQILFKDYSTLRRFSQFTTLPAITMVILGTAVLFASVFGAYAARKQNIRMFQALAITMTCMILSTIIGMAICMVIGKITGEEIEKDLYKTMQEYGKSKAISSFWDHIQKRHKCCGINDRADWVEQRRNYWAQKASNGTYPDSCCLENKDDCGAQGTKVHDRGCLAEVEGYLTKRRFVLPVVFAVMIVVMIDSELSAIIMLRKLKKKQHQITWVAEEDGSRSLT